MSAKSKWIVSAVVISITLTIFLFLLQGPAPSGWDRIHRDMPYDEVCRIIGEPKINKISGYFKEAFWIKENYNGYWTFRIIYEPSGIITAGG
jgi:hypothetical protein